MLQSDEPAAVSSDEAVTSRSAAVEDVARLVSLVFLTRRVGRNLQISEGGYGISQMWLGVWVLSPFTY
eukprot:1180561-Prorocentrum_minimum.AAC.9